MELKTEVKNLGDLVVEDMEKIVSHNVTLHHPNGVLESVIKSVQRLNKTEGAPGRDKPFSIIFQCDDHVMPVQASVRIEHADFGLENVLITPVLKGEEDQDKPHIYFEAIFG